MKSTLGQYAGLFRQKKRERTRLDMAALRAMAEEEARLRGVEIDLDARLLELAEKDHGQDEKFLLDALLEIAQGR